MITIASYLYDLDYLAFSRGGGVGVPVGHYGIFITLVCILFILPSVLHPTIFF